MPTDDEGYLGRECPDAPCEGYFKVKPGTGLTGSDLSCHCPYCGHTDSHQVFWTSDQIEYAESIALRRFSEALNEDLKGLEFEHKPKGAFGIGISMKLQPGAPIPIRHYRERQLETHIRCDTCTLEYAVYGLFGFCPDCATHNSLQILLRNLALVEKQIALAGGLEEADFRQHLIEDSLENCISAFDGFGREASRVFAEGRKEAAKPVSFQNLESASEKLASRWALDFRGAVPSDTWSLAHQGFMRRHVIAHRAGVVDQRYIDETGDTTVEVGRRVVISEDEVSLLAAAVEVLGRTLTSLLFK